MWKEMVEKERRTAMVHVDGGGTALATWANRLRQPACLLLSAAVFAALLGALQALERTLPPRFLADM